jgi:5'-deoxynucleotidase YfbR-like HD superfamily hydrolase
MKDLVSNTTEVIADLLKKSGVTKTIDILFLSREISNIPRCHTLPVTNKGTLAGHILTSVYLFDFLNHNMYIDPFVSHDKREELITYILYHDIEEILLGDIPFHVNKLIGEFPNKVRDEISKNFHSFQNPLTSDLHNVAKQIDIMDLMLTIRMDPKFNGVTFESYRLKTVYHNCLDVMISLQKNALHKIDYEKVVSLT